MAIRAYNRAIRRPLLLPALFLLCAMPVLTFLALRVPTGESPDEVAHIVRMESLLHGNVVGYRMPRLDHAGTPIEDGGVTANAGLLAAGFTFVPGTPLAERTLTRARQDELANLSWQPSPEFISIPNTAAYFPLPYAPGAAGMQVAKWLGEGPWEAILAARLANAATFTILGLAALLVARRLQGLLFAVLVLPMTLWLAASCNQDGLVIASAVLAVAALTRGTSGGWWAGAMLVAVVVAAKPTYLPLAGVVVVALPTRGLSMSLRLAGGLLASVPGLAWFAVARRFAAVPFVRGEPFEAGPYWPGEPGQVFGSVDPGLQLQVLLHRPSLMLTLPVDSIWEHGRWLLSEVVGILAILDLLLPAGLYALWFAALLALAVGESFVPPRDTPSIPAVVRLLTLLSLAATVLVVFDGQYLSWTRTGAAQIDGIQGRYFIPLLPFLGLVLPAWQTPLASGFRGLCRAPACFAGLVGAVVIPGLVVATYYLR